jgi:hypothetical protein
MAATPIRPPNMSKIPRRLTSRAKHWWNICPSWPFVYICKFIRL